MTDTCPAALSVNLNKVALIRNSREGDFPSLVEFGTLAMEAGAAGLTVHPRPDQRHIRPGDVIRLATLLRNWPEAEFNIEGNPFAAAHGTYPGMLALVEQTRPHQATLVPDSNDQLTSDHGFDLRVSADSLKPIIAQLRDIGCRICLFMDPDLDQISRARDLGVDRIELYPGPYAEHWNDPHRLPALFEQYQAAAVHAGEIGLGVNAGHDLNLENLPLFSSLPGLLEVSIGHALTVDALRMGMTSAVKAYLKALGHKRSGHKAPGDMV